MAMLRHTPSANGAPGIIPRWTHSAKDVVGTAYSDSSRVWFTLSGGVISEIYFPTLDRPQVRDLQFLVSDGESFFADPHRHMHSSIEYLGEHGLGVRLTNRDREDRYRLVMEIISDPHQPCLLIDGKVEADPTLERRLHVYALLAPHLNVGGWGHNGNLACIAGRVFLTAHKDGIWLAMTTTKPFVKRSCGYVGTTDGWQDLSDNFQMDYELAGATDGNIALTGEINLAPDRHFTLAVAFGGTLHRAVTTLFQSLGTPFHEHRAKFLAQWNRACQHLSPLERVAGDDGSLYRRSRELLMAHEDKSYRGAIVASMSISWGEVKGDDDLGGYHLVWTRDLVQSATGLLAAGDTTIPLRALVYLACTQQGDGGFPQNFWIDGQPYQCGIQLDEVAFPIILAWRLRQAGALADFDPYPMVRAAAHYLITRGPATPQERWEENSGYSASALASNIAALICAACFARERADEGTAKYLDEYADFLESHVESWTVTGRGTLVSDIPRHYIRINPVNADVCVPDEDPDHGLVFIHNLPPGSRAEFPAAEIVDAGFLELVRYGIRTPGDSLIEASLQVVDAVLRVDFPAGPCWRRYTHDGYGQRDDGNAFQGWGRGRPWPLLTGERGHYELAAGRNARTCLNAIERFATPTRLLAEQLWDQVDIPQFLMRHGKPTGSAMPLMWAHAEYIKLLRSIDDECLFDLIPEVTERYRKRRRRRLEVWKHNRRPVSVYSGSDFRIQAAEPFMLHWSKDDWQHSLDTQSHPTGVGINFVDVPVAPGDRAMKFTFFWTNDGRWEHRDYAVSITGCNRDHTERTPPSEAR